MSNKLLDGKLEQFSLKDVSIETIIYKLSRKFFSDQWPKKINRPTSLEILIDKSYNSNSSSIVLSDN